MSNVIKKAWGFLPEGAQDLIISTCLMIFCGSLMFCIIYYPSLLILDKLIEAGITSSKESLFNSLVAIFLMLGFVGIIVSVEATRNALYIALQIICAVAAIALLSYSFKGLVLDKEPVVIIINNPN